MGKFILRDMEWDNDFGKNGMTFGVNSTIKLSTPDYCTCNRCPCCGKLIKPTSDAFYGDFALAC